MHHLLATLSETELHGQGAVVWERPRDDRQQYEQDRGTVKPYSQRLRRWLQGWDAPAVHRRTGRSRGHLDRRQL